MFPMTRSTRTDAGSTIVEGLLVRARSEGSLDPSIDIASAARFAVGAYIGVEQLAGGKDSPAFVERIDDHMRFTLRAIGLHSQLLERE